MDPEILGALIGPILTAGLAGLAVGFKEWRRRRESADQRHDAAAGTQEWTSSTPDQRVRQDRDRREQRERAHRRGD